MDKLMSLTQNELEGLCNKSLCDRMEAILIMILDESYPNLAGFDKLPRHSIKDFFDTKLIQNLSHDHQRASLIKCFEYLVQHEYLSRISGWINGAIFDENYDEEHSWLSPRIHSINCAALQIKIVGSAIACERIMDLLHIIAMGQPITSKKKFKFFATWLLNPKNRFLFFAPNLTNISTFRSHLRTAEEHKSSSLPKHLLLLQQPSFENMNQPLNLLNILLSMWQPLLDILNNKTPLTTAGSGGDVDWLDSISKNDIKIIQKISEIKKQLFLV